MLFEGRDMVIEAFKDHTFRFFEKAKDLESDSESDSKFEESRGEKLKLRKQKSDKLNKMITAKEDKEQLDTTDMHDLENEESAEQRRKTKGQGLKILSPQQMPPQQLHKK